MMDECLDEFFFSSSWSDENVKDIMSELCPEQANEMLLSANGVLDEEYDNNHSHTSMINSNGSSESLAAQDASSIVLGKEADYGTDMIFNSGEVRLQEDGQFCFGNPLNGMANGCSEATKIGCQYITPTSNLSSLNLGSLEQLPAGANLVQYNTAEPSVYQRFNQDFRSPNPQFCTHPPFEGVSSISPGMGQDIIEGFGLQAGDYVGNDLYAMENHSANLSASASSKGKQDMDNHVLSSFASGPQMTMAAPGLSSLPQTTSAAPSGECIGTGKPRARARRGQATDPHSIAERLRREKIAERMKSLQELLPNPNKTDKASMLDEIIEYVKFLQLQVKVLSMSRLGAAEAVAPLITSGQAEGANGLSLSRSTSQIGDIVFPSDDIAFERELVKLMESNVTKAMQYLQTKGFCLMPMALASAISAGKEKNPSSSAPLFEDLKRNGFADHPACDENDIIRNSLVSSNGERNLSTESSLVNKCVGPVTELKPKI